MTNLLLVDDERAFLSTLGKRLEKRSLPHRSVYSGQEALDSLDEHPGTDVVVLDVKMPAMDGLETLKRIKAKVPLVEVIMLTGHATVESAIEGLKSGAVDYLMKPADLEDIIEKATDAFNRRVNIEEKIRVARMRGLMKSPREMLRNA